MTSFFILGAYWHDRPLRLRQYADTSRNFLCALCNAHPVFQRLESLGNRLGPSVRLAQDLSNLDDLIYRHAGSSDQIYSHPNPDGSPTWQSITPFGHDMWFDTGKPAEAGGLRVRISAGICGRILSNAVTIAYPMADTQDFPYPEFYEYDFIKSILLDTVRIWKPEDALVVSHDFSRAIGEGPRATLGWLTYLHDRRPLALRGDPGHGALEIEAVDANGVLISLDRKMVSANDARQVHHAKRVRSALIAEKFIKE